MVPWLFLPIPKEGYVQMAAMTHQRHMRLFRIRPKLHMMCELGQDMKELGECNRLVLSPICTCTWSDEDFIGRVSRCARSTHGSTLSISTMNRCLGMYSLQLAAYASKKR